MAELYSSKTVSLTCRRVPERSTAKVCSCSVLPAMSQLVVKLSTPLLWSRPSTDACWPGEPAARLTAAVGEHWPHCRERSPGRTLAAYPGPGSSGQVGSARHLALTQRWIYPRTPKTFLIASRYPSEYWRPGSRWLPSVHSFQALIVIALGSGPEATNCCARESDVWNSCGVLPDIIGVNGSAQPRRGQPSQHQIAARCSARLCACVGQPSPILKRQLKRSNGNVSRQDCAVNGADAMWPQSANGDAICAAGANVPAKRVRADPGWAHCLRLGTRDRPDPESQISALIICEPLG